MKFISWNVNGIRAAQKKGFLDFLENEAPDVLCVQETKAHPEQLDEDLRTPPGYTSFYSSAEKKGYSGVATFVRDTHHISSVRHGIDVDEFDREGRFLITEINNFLLYNIYFPSGTTGDVRQDFKYKFLDSVFEHFKTLSKKDRERLIVCGDFNICHKAIDIHHPEKARKQELSGFLEDECEWMDSFAASGFIDSFRHIHPLRTDVYSWWSYRARAREKNLGWRIDYFFANQALENAIAHADIYTDVSGSDHCPILLELNL